MPVLLKTHTLHLKLISQYLKSNLKIFLGLIYKYIFTGLFAMRWYMYYVTELFFFSRHLREAQAALFVVQLLHLVRLFVIPWAAACQASLPFTVSWSLLKLMSIESMMASNHLILCHPLLLLPSVFSSIRVFSRQSALQIRWPKYWSFSFSISPSNEY